MNLLSISLWNFALVFSILGLIDHTHSPAPERIDNEVLRDGLANHERALGLRVAMLGI
jgi:hypothetical protein